MATSSRTTKDAELPIRRLIARRDRALARFDHAWRDAANRSCSEEDVMVAYMLASSDDPPNPVENPNEIPPPPPPEDEEDEEDETETTRTVAFSVRRSEKRVTKSDGELTVKFHESSTEVMHTSDDPPNPVDGPIDPIPPSPDPPQELMRLASEKPNGAHGSFAKRREELSRRFDRQIEHARDWGKGQHKRLT